MSYSIYKYPLERLDVVEVEMPKDAEILSAHSQQGVITLWARVNLDETRDNEIRKIRIYGTGHRISETHLKFIGTVQLSISNLRSYVFHVFEELK